MTLPPIFRCPDCERVLLIVMDVDDPTLPDEIAVKVDGHTCADGPNKETLMADESHDVLKDTWPDLLPNQCQASLVIDGATRHCLFVASHEHHRHINQFTNRRIEWVDYSSAKVT